MLIANHCKVHWSINIKGYYADPACCGPALNICGAKSLCKLNVNIINRKNGIRTLANNIHLHAVSYGWHWQLEVSWCWAQIQASCLSASQVFSIHRQIGLTTWTFHAIQSESCAVTLAMDQCMVRALQQGKWYIMIHLLKLCTMIIQAFEWSSEHGSNPSWLQPAPASPQTCVKPPSRIFSPLSFVLVYWLNRLNLYMQTYQYVWNAKRSFFCEEFCPTTMSCPTAHLQYCRLALKTLQGVMDGHGVMDIIQDHTSRTSRA